MGSKSDNTVSTGPWRGCSTTCGEGVEVRYEPNGRLSLEHFQSCSTAMDSMRNQIASSHDIVFQCSGERNSCVYQVLKNAWKWILVKDSQPKAQQLGALEGCVA